MKKDVLIIAHFCNSPSEKANNRFNYIAAMLVENDYDVELVTSDFSHNAKVKRVHNFKEYGEGTVNYKFTMLHESGYKKNVSVKRYFSHYIFAKNLKAYLSKRKKPDMIYCAVPSLSAAGEAAKYAKRNKIKFIIDVQDLWPEAFKLVFKFPFIDNLFLYPLSHKANFIYRCADEIVAVSDTYKRRATSVSNKAIEGVTIYLGTNLEEVEKYKITEKMMETDTEFIVAYVGTLGHSYDIKIIIDALAILEEKYGPLNILFKIIGDGPLKESFQKYAKEKNVNAKFTGRLNYPDAIKELYSADLAVNPISRGSAASIINKVGDYIATSLPVINSQESEEFRELVEKYDIGLNASNTDPEDISEKIYFLYQNEGIRKQKSINNRYLAEKEFNRATTYKRILALL